MTTGEISGKNALARVRRFPSVSTAAALRVHDRIHSSHHLRDDLEHGCHDVTETR